MYHIKPGTTHGATDRTLTTIQQVDYDVVWEEECGYKDTENNICRAIDEKLNLLVPDAYKSNLRVAMGQG